MLLDVTIARPAGEFSGIADFFLILQRAIHPPRPTRLPMPCAPTLEKRHGVRPAASHGRQCGE
jgi:hypothetical protein